MFSPSQSTTERSSGRSIGAVAAPARRASPRNETSQFAGNDMRLLIAGWQGQVARSLVEMAPGRKDVDACAVGRAALDICEAKSIERALSAISPTVVINSAAYT